MGLQLKKLVGDGGPVQCAVHGFDEGLVEKVLVGRFSANGCEGHCEGIETNTGESVYVFKSTQTYLNSGQFGCFTIRILFGFFTI